MPTWELILCAIAFVVGAIVVAVSGLLATRALVKTHISEGHNTVAGHIFRTTVGFYSILLAFVVVIVW